MRLHLWLILRSGETFKQPIIGIGRVLLVLNVWNAPVALQRGWCLFEIMTTLQLKDSVQFDIVLDTAQQATFAKAIMRDVKGAINKAMMIGCIAIVYATFAKKKETERMNTNRIFLAIKKIFELKYKSYLENIQVNLFKAV